MYIYCQVNVRPLLCLPTSMHQALPSPAWPATSHFHCSFRRQARSLTLVRWLSVSLDVSCSSAVTVKGLPSGRPCMAGEAAVSPVGAATCSWGWHGVGTRWDRGGHVWGLSQLHGRAFWGQKGGERPVLLMLQGSTVSMATPPAFPSQGWMPQGERWHSNHILGRSVRGCCSGNASPAPAWWKGGMPVGGHRWRAGMVICVHPASTCT